MNCHVAVVGPNVRGPTHKVSAVSRPSTVYQTPESATLDCAHTHRRHVDSTCVSSDFVRRASTVTSSPTPTFHSPFSILHTPLSTLHSPHTQCHALYLCLSLSPLFFLRALSHSARPLCLRFALLLTMSSSPSSWSPSSSSSSASPTGGGDAVSSRVSNDSALTGNYAIQTNSMTRAYAQRYFDDFCLLFEVTGNGSLRSTKKVLSAVEEWYNRSYLLISLITGIPLEEVHFNGGMGRSGIANVNENKQTLLHIYAVSYGVLLRMAATLSRSIPEKYRPRLSAVTDEEEEDN